MIDFGKSARVALIALAIVSVVGTLTAMFFGEKFTTSESYQNDTYSRSAIGHRLFVDLLEESGRDVSIVETDERVFDDSPLFFIEPRVASTGDESDFSEQLDAALVSVLVLPKRIGVPDESREFIESHQVVPRSSFPWKKRYV